MTLLDRLRAPGPKRILALDGGGIRGALTLGYLKRIENILRHRHNNSKLKLCEYFDLIGGTSTGSIIAAALAIGLDVDEVREKYLQLGGTVFSQNSFLRRYVQSSFDAASLKIELEEIFSNITLGGNEIKTGLCVVTKRVDTNSTWFLLNHPDGKYFDHNKGILLRDVIRASTAAPTYFDPELISDVGFGQRAVFIDGGVSMANNPALQLFLIASLSGYKFNWQAGEENLLIVSVGTGVWHDRNEIDAVTGYKVWDWGKRVPSMLMEDASWQNQLLLQTLSKTATPWHIDDEVGDLTSDLLPPTPLMTYLRYDSWLDKNGLQNLKLERLVDKLDSLREMSAGENRFDLAQIGETAAAEQVEDGHFPEGFNL